MEKTKFQELCKVYCKAQTDFENFREDCHQLAMEMVDELKTYFGIPDSQFSLYTVTEQNEFEIVSPALINAMTLRSDSYWQFGIGLTLCRQPEKLPQELVLIPVLVRKDLDNKFFAKYGAEKEEFEVILGSKENFHPFFDFLYDSILKTYSEQYHQFVGQSTKRKMGFK